MEEAKKVEEIRLDDESWRLNRYKSMQIRSIRSLRNTAFSTTGKRQVARRCIKCSSDEIESWCIFDLTLPLKPGAYWQACDQEFSLNYKLLQRYIIRVIHPDAPIPCLADHRVTWSHFSLQHEHG